MGLKKLALLLTTALCTIQTFSQSFKKELTGELALSTLSTDAEFKQWFLKGYEEHRASSAQVERLSKVVGKYSFVFVIGTWCDDTQEQLPRWIKVLQQAGVREEAMKIYGIDEKKTVPADIIKRYKIESVPTLIVFDTGKKEIGRIVETPAKTIEADLLSLVK